MSEPYYDEDGITIYHGDCRDFAHLSVDHIVTDPPYGRAAMPLWDALATLATATLSPGGWLAAYSGQACLPEVMASLSVEGLTYRWTQAVSYVGGGQVVSVGEMAVLSEWKPIVVCRRQPFGSPRGERGQFVAGGRDCLRDFLRRGGREKDLHPWAQPAGEARQLVEMFSRPGDLILDPFMGSGTTLRAAKDLGRRAIGIEVDEAHCEVAAQRMAQHVLALAESGATE